MISDMLDTIWPEEARKGDTIIDCYNGRHPVQHVFHTDNRAGTVNILHPDREQTYDLTKMVRVEKGA